MERSTQLFEGMERGSGKFVTIRDEHISHAANRIAEHFNPGRELYAAMVDACYRTPIGFAFQAYERTATGTFEPVGRRFFVK